MPPITPFEVVGRGIGYLAQAALVGALAFKLFVWWPALRRAEIDESDIVSAVTRRSRLVIRIAIVGLIISTALWLLAQLSLSGQSLGAWLATRVGRIWIGRAATVIALAVLSDELALTHLRDGTGSETPSPDPTEGLNDSRQGDLRSGCGAVGDLRRTWFRDGAGSPTPSPDPAEGLNDSRQGDLRSGHGAVRRPAPNLGI